MVEKGLDRSQIRLDRGAPYSLVYGDFQPGNLLLCENEPPCLILLDFGTIHYGLWPWDFVKIFHRILDRDEAGMTRFLSKYWEQRPEADRDYFGQVFPWLELYYHVEKAGSIVQKVRQG